MKSCSNSSDFFGNSSESCFDFFQVLWASSFFVCQLCTLRDISQSFHHTSYVSCSKDHHFLIFLSISHSNFRQFKTERMHTRTPMSLCTRVVGSVNSTARQIPSLPSLSTLACSASPCHFSHLLSPLGVEYHTPIHRRIMQTQFRNSLFAVASSHLE